MRGGPSPQRLATTTICVATSLQRSRQSQFERFRASGGTSSVETLNGARRRRGESLHASRRRQRPQRRPLAPLYDVLVGSVTFLGGMNLAFCVLALVLLVASSEFPNPSQRAMLVAVVVLL